MTILVTGGHGQLGRALSRRGGARNTSVSALGHAELDIRDIAAVTRQLDALAPSVVPNVVINAAAYNAVDRAETDRQAAFEVNADAPAGLALQCADRGIRLFHVSTDYVFDGTAARPYAEHEPVAPINAYGESKAAGERAVTEAGGIVVRTSWVFAAHGNGFVQTVLRLAAHQPVLEIIADQIGCPTWADDLADGLLDLAAIRDLAPIYHYSGEPPISRHGWAVAIVEMARRHRAMICERIDPIQTQDDPRRPRRPRYSALATDRIRALGITPRPWRDGLASAVAGELAGASEP